MSAEREVHGGLRGRAARRARRRAAGALLMASALVLTGCVSMPDNGSVNRVDSSHRAEPDSQVRVFGVSPQKGEEPQQIVRGFLEATTSDEATFSTAKEYLTDDMVQHWNPDVRTTVLSDGPSPGAAQPELSRGGSGYRTGYTVRVTGDRMAEVDRKHAYSADEGKYARDFHLSKVRGEWRIDQLPDGLVLGESDFQRIYRPISAYYYAQLGPDAESVAGGKDVLVSDSIYLRRRIDPVTKTVSALLSGPTDWLDPVVSSAFPPGARLADKQHLSLDDSGALSVRLNAQGARAGKAQCARMAAQVLHTVQNQASARVSKVRLAGPGDDTLCEQTREQAEVYEPGRLNGRVERQYFIDSKHRVAAFTGLGEKHRPVEGALGTGGTEFGSVAVSRSEREGAAVTRGGKSLYVSPLAQGSDLGKPVLESKAAKEKDRLTTPSWDGLGDLWVADRDPKRPRLLRLRGGKERPEQVRVPGLRKGERIESLRIASDGVRIALRVKGKDGRSTLQLGRVERAGTPDKPRLAVDQLRNCAPQMEDVIAASWAGGSRLVVVGRESGSVQQLRYMEVDGSVSNQPTLPGINDVTGVAASEDESKPLLADSEDGIVRLPPDANWKTLTDSGSAPVYPG
ncbi:LpqB family beta-propeller domain-containing protein [Streptomyces sp. ODS28]|uniref:LpqB family beta-propeller domain-containing protein n=1 Tax=Streptomyces sp. ODS28 TaxID=3136688 RepID=UPI0031ECD65A